MSRKDDKGRNLNKGEYQRKQDGRYIYKYTDMYGKSGIVYATSLQELRRKETEIAKEVMQGIDYSKSNITLQELFDDFMELKDDLKPTTRLNYQRMWDSNVKDNLIANRSVKRVSVDDVMRFYKELSKKGLSKATVKYIHLLINSCFEKAVKNHYILYNPAKDAMKDAKIKDDAKEKTPLTESQIDKLYEFCENSKVYSVYLPFLKIAIGSCMRIGELCGLRWSDVDMKNRTINVNHQLVYKATEAGGGCHFFITDVKTDAGNRIIPMTNDIYNAFVERKRQIMILGMRCDAVIDGYSDFVFFNSNGKLFAPNAINSFLLGLEKSYNKANKEPIPHLSAHILRHTGCTLLASKGLDVKALQAIMGHTDAQVTMNTYNHSSLERTIEALEKLDLISECM